LYPSAAAVGFDSDNIGAGSASASEETPAAAMTIIPFSIKARRERLMDFSFSCSVIV
jgi:hypothetical protein